MWDQPEPNTNVPNPVQSRGGLSWLGYLRSAGNPCPPAKWRAVDEFVTQRGGVPESGPLSILINVPELIKRGEYLRAYLRGYETVLSTNIREWGMLVTAREMATIFDWEPTATADAEHRSGHGRG